MNAYDFDLTVFRPDSSYAFYCYCLRHFAFAVIPTMPGSVLGAVRYFSHRITAKQLKEQLFSFLPAIGDIDGAVEGFWRENERRLQSWYLAQRREDDVIISGSPEFLLRPVCDRLGIRLIATPMDKKTGKINGLNCHDSEKVRRFSAQYPGEHIESFYSDSLADEPMARLADKAYLVRKDRLLPWPEKK